MPTNWTTDVKCSAKSYVNHYIGNIMKEKIPYMVIKARQAHCVFNKINNRNNNMQKEKYKNINWLFKRMNKLTKNENNINRKIKIINIVVEN